MEEQNLNIVSSMFCQRLVSSACILAIHEQIVVSQNIRILREVAFLVLCYEKPNALVISERKDTVIYARSFDSELLLQFLAGVNLARLEQT